MVTDRGLQYDRRWMLIDDNNRFISQRECSQMALLKTAINDSYLVVTNNVTNTSINIPLTTRSKGFIQVTIWDDSCVSVLMRDEINAWFTKALGISVRLVYMPDDSQRLVEEKYAKHNDITSFSDAFPFLLIGQSSLDDLNTRLDNAVQIDRFRPNIVFSGAAPYCEDTIDSFTINNINFNGAKLCARCNMITINQNDSTSAKEPTKTLARYRRRDNKIYFGQNLIHNGSGKFLSVTSCI
ncbi:MOSC domain-containing protein [Mucilaginibacter antarcticus]|uniref:MOSC domain-containing protein n=1 Tax=Mucilaginibacter antarcticus TaxID=1855725 RepID=UPI0036322CDB